MKKILISIFLSASATEALAQSAAAETAPWFPITSAMYALSPLEDKKIALSTALFVKRLHQARYPQFPLMDNF